jgi:hypothetical protein
MIKRLLIIGALTGAAHLTILIVLKILTGEASVSEIKTIGEIDSIFNLIINILAAGSGHFHRSGNRNNRP